MFYPLCFLEARAIAEGECGVTAANTAVINTPKDSSLASASSAVTVGALPTDDDFEEVNSHLALVLLLVVGLRLSYSFNDWNIL